MKRHRVIYNQDCTNLFAITKEPLTPAHVDRMVDEVADGGADVMLINPNAQKTCYPSRVWQPFWEGYTPGYRGFFGPVADNEIPGREHWIGQMKHLADQGCDYLARALARCRHKGIVPGITVRMNDMHDAPTPTTHMFSRFYMEHPEFRLNNGPACGWGATGLNYEFAEVRNHYLSLIRELTHDYDVEVLELDFLRFHCYFPRNHFADHAEIMTAFLRDVRGVLADSGRKLALMARIPATPASAYELGFDVATWAREGLVDGVSAGAFLNTHWSIAVDEFRTATNGSVAIYACTDFCIDRRPDLPPRALPTSPDFLRGFAAAHLAAGADGVELFNFFCAREAGWKSKEKEPAFAVLREMGALEPLRGRNKTYTLTSGWMVGEVDGAAQVPVTVEGGRPRSFRMFMAAEPSSGTVQASLALQGADTARPDQLWLHVNNTPVGPATAIQSLPESTQNARCAIFTVPAAALRDGENTITVRNEGGPVTVISADINVLA